MKNIKFRHVWLISPLREERTGIHYCPQNGFWAPKLFLVVALSFLFHLGLNLPCLCNY